MSEVYDKENVLEEYEKIKLEKIDELEMYLKMKGIDSLYPILNTLKQEIFNVKNRIDQLEIKMGLKQIPINISEIEEIMNKVSDYLKDNIEAYPSDVADNLDLSIIDVMKAIQALKNQEKIEVIE